MSADHPSLPVVLDYVRWAVKLSDLRRTPRAVALEVATHYNRREGCSRPSWTEIGDVLDLERRAVGYAIRDVTAAGIWRPETSRGRSTRYRFPLAGVVHTRAPACTGGSGVPVHAHAPTRAPACTPPVHARAPELDSELDIERAAPPWLAHGITASDWLRMVGS